MRRREFISCFGWGAMAIPVAVAAQPRVRRVGVLFSFAPGDTQQQPNITALIEGLQDFGWRQGHNIQLDFRFGSGDPSRMEAYAADLVNEGPDVLFGNGTAVVTALRQRTNSIPIVFVHISEPVSGGFVSNVARPFRKFGAWQNWADALAVHSRWVQETIDDYTAAASKLLVPDTKAERQEGARQGGR